MAKPNLTSAPALIHELENYLISQTLYSNLLDSITTLSQTRAQTAWTDTPPSDPIPTPNLDLNSLPLLHSLPTPLQTLLQTTLLTPTFQTVFATTLTSLNTQTLASFRTLWLDRIVAKTQLYTLGLDALDPAEDAKLHAQLTQLLTTHIAHEMVPDALARAEKNNLLRDTKLRKAVEKLKAALALQDNGAGSGASSKEPDPDSPAPTPSLPTTLAALEKFASKASITPFDATTLSHRKQTHILDLVRGMRKDGDAARLFLTLVVVLVARRRAGVVYATGKYAPKLMRLLRDDGHDGDDGGEVYARLEAWKEAVKRGKVTAGEREAMRALAVEASAVRSDGGEG